MSGQGGKGTYYQARYHYVEAMRIDPDTNTPDGGFLSPHEVSHAETAGWLLANGFRDFKVHGTGPFGIEFLDANKERALAQPGDWLILIRDKLLSMTDPEFQQMYEGYDAPEAG